MNILEFKDIKANTPVLYQHNNDIYATTVIETSNRHPSIPMIRLNGGFNILYGSRDKAIYADSAANRTELLLEDTAVLTEINLEEL